jgi:hypothetical protein
LKVYRDETGSKRPKRNNRRRVTESTGPISHPCRQFIMWQKGNIAGGYSTKKRLLSEMIEEMLQLCRKCLKHVKTRVIEV